MRQSIGIDKN